MQKQDDFVESVAKIIKQNLPSRNPGLHGMIFWPFFYTFAEFKCNFTVCHGIMQKFHVLQKMPKNNTVIPPYYDPLYYDLPHFKTHFVMTNCFYYIFNLSWTTPHNLQFTIDLQWPYTPDERPFWNEWTWKYPLKYLSNIQAIHSSHQWAVS